MLAQNDGWQLRESILLLPSFVICLLICIFVEMYKWYIIKIFSTLAIHVGNQKQPKGINLSEVLEKVSPALIS